MCVSSMRLSICREGRVTTSLRDIYSRTCNHDDLVEITEDIDLKGTLYSRDGARRVFPWILERQGIETLFGTQENQLQEKEKKTMLSHHKRSRS